MKLYISDLHFFHENMNVRMDCRGFASAEEMNRHMISQWNSRVKKRDEVYILGDLSWGKAEETNAVLRELNGHLYLIQGNHDRFLKDRTFDLSRFEWVKPYAEIHDNQRKVVLCHYPVFCYNGQNRLTDSGKPRTYMLYGHVHNSFDEVLVNRFIEETRAAVRPVFRSEGDADAPQTIPIPCHMINCFCMFSDYIPLSLDAWIAVDDARREKMRYTEL